MTNLIDLGNRGLNGIAFDIAPISIELDAYGEAETATWLRQVSPEVHAEVSEVALSKFTSLGCILDKAICLAAVQVFEGEARELRRKRRVYKK